MGKKKIINMSYINDRVSRNVTFCKRKKGLIKKAMEISLLCGQQVALYIYDPEKMRLVSYTSTRKLNMEEIEK